MNNKCYNDKIVQFIFFFFIGSSLIIWDTKNSNIFLLAYIQRFNIYENCNDHKISFFLRSRITKCTMAKWLIQTEGNTTIIDTLSKNFRYIVYIYVYIDYKIIYIQHSELSLFSRGRPILPKYNNRSFCRMILKLFNSYLNVKWN